MLELIKEQYSDLADKVLSTATQLADSPLSSKTCLTHKSHSIGESHTQILGLTRIDLANLTDIVPLTLNLQKARPAHKPTRDDISDELMTMTHLPNDFCLKLARTPYLPYKNGRDDIEEDAYLPIPGGRSNYIYNT